MTIDELIDSGYEHAEKQDCGTLKVKQNSDPYLYQFSQVASLSPL